MGLGLDIVLLSLFFPKPCFALEMILCMGVGFSLFFFWEFICIFATAFGGRGCFGGGEKASLGFAINDTLFRTHTSQLYDTR